MTPQQAMDGAIALEDGQKIAIPFTSKAECDSFRIQLYRERKKMQYSLSLVKDEAKKLTITRQKHPDTGQYSLIITKESSETNAIIINKDGTTAPFIPPPIRQDYIRQEVFIAPTINWDNLAPPEEGDDDINLDLSPSQLDG